MKKVLLVGAVALLGLASCKKDYTCECSATIDGTNTVLTTQTIKDTKSNATSTCEKASVGEIKCKIK